MRLEKPDKFGEHTHRLREWTTREGQRQRLGPQTGEYLSWAISEFNILFPALESALNKNEGDWPRQLFIKHGSLFLKILENKAEWTTLEVYGLVRILDEFGVPEHARVLDVSCGTVNSTSVYSVPTRS